VLFRSVLAAKATQGEADLEAAKTQSKQEFQAKVAAAKESAKTSTANLKVSAAGKEDEAAQWWGDVHNKWKDHISQVRQDLEDKKATQDAKMLVKLAERAEKNAADAVDFAYAAYEEAVYEVLNAVQIRSDADAAAAATQ
jgi:hypothetical protein